MRQINVLDYHVVSYNPVNDRLIQVGAFGNGHHAREFAEKQLERAGDQVQFMIVKGELVDLLRHEKETLPKEDKPPQPENELRSRGVG